jgi:Short C-terminal domain
MPGLLRGVARTAVVAGTATAVSNRVSRRQANRWAQQNPEQTYVGANPVYSAEQPQYAPPPPPPAAGPSTEDKLAQLKQLGELKTSGILTEAEFEAQKAKILAG